MKRTLVKKILAKNPFSSSPTRRPAKTCSKTNICFIHIPKTGGKTIIYDLKMQIGLKKINKELDFKYFSNNDHVTFGHIHYLSLLKTGFVSDDYHKSSYKFAIVRNPYDRIISLYNYLNSRSELDGWGFDHFLDHVLIRRPPVGLYNKVGLSQTNPQCDWVIDEDGQFITDDIFKLEELEKLHQTFLEKNGITLNLENRRNITKNIEIKNNDLIAKQDRIEKINEIYKRDFHLFDYEMK